MEAGFFQLDKKERDEYVERAILYRFSKEVKPVLRSRIESIVCQFEGWDSNVLTVFFYAAEKRMVEEYAARLEDFYRVNLQNIAPRERRLAKVSAAVQTQNFLLELYKEFGSTYTPDKLVVSE